MSGKVGVIVMAVLLGLYLAFAVQYGIVLITTGEPVAIAMGVALLILPFIGGWVLVRELVFVRNGQRLLRTLTAEGGLPVDDLPRMPSGRIVPEAADAEFPQYKEAVEAEPESWRAWLRLGLAYDASGDRGRARWATREAIRLQKAA